jgi:hypothetical protein
MNVLEDKLRTAMRDTGEEVAPHSVPPLRLRGARRRLGIPRIAGRRWSAWLAPLAAAASVAAVVAASLAISATFHGHTPGSPHANGTGPQGVPLGRPAALRKAPPYFVDLPGDWQARQAQVRSTVTGRTLATVRPPAPYRIFSWVSGAADDRTFVLAAQRYWNIAPGNRGARAEGLDNTTPTVFFRLTFHPGSGAAHLTRLAVPGRIQSARLAGLAISPDGTKLALDYRQSIQVVTLATGAVRQWVWPGNGWIGNWKPYGQIFSWSADGKTLEFQQWGGGKDGKDDGITTVRLLDVTAPGSSLRSARIALTFPTRPGGLNFSDLNTFLTPDGTRIVTATEVYPRRTAGPSRGEITEFSARTGQPILAQDEFAPLPGWQDVLWAGAKGRALVVQDPRGKGGKYGRAEILGVLTGGKFTPIPHGTFQDLEMAW